MSNYSYNPFRRGLDLVGEQASTPINPNIRVLEDDFIVGTTEAGEIGLLGWSFTAGSIISYVTVGGTSIGVTRRSGTTANSSSSMYLSGGPTTPVIYNNQLVSLTFKFQIKTSISNHNHFLGFSSDLGNSTFTPNDLIGFKYIVGNNQWVIVTRSGGLETSFNSSVPLVADSDVTLEIIKNSINNISFKINGSLITTITTNIPSESTSLVVGHNMVNISTATSDVVYNYFNLSYLLVK